MMQQNAVLSAIRQNPKILRQVCQIPELRTRQLNALEIQVFDNLEKEAFARQAFRRDGRQSRYYRGLSKMQRSLLRLEDDYMRNRPGLRGRALHAEIARVYNGLKGDYLTWFQVKQELEMATEILVSLEVGNYVVETLTNLFNDIA
jgi:hypothetical protein